MESVRDPFVGDPFAGDLFVGVPFSNPPTRVQHHPPHAQIAQRALPVSPLTSSSCVQHRVALSKLRAARQEQSELEEESARAVE